MKENIEENIKKFIDNLNDNEIQSVESNSNFTFYINKNMWKVKDENTYTNNELLQDYFDNSQYEYVIKSLLEKRGNWEMEKNPLNVESITYSYTEADIKNEKILKKSSLKDETWEKMSKEEKQDTVNQYINKQMDIRVKNKMLGSNLNREIQVKSKINNRIAKLTRVVGNKYTFYSILKEYTKNPEKMEKNIPNFFIINVNENGFIEELKTFFEEAQSEIWLLKPMAGYGGKGLTIKNKTEMIDIIKTHTSKFDYSRWMIIEFKQSFLWKLHTNHPDSSKLLKDTQNRQGQFRGEKINLWNKDKVPTYNKLRSIKPSVISTRYPESITRLQYNDTLGRINKGRFWFTYQIKNKSLEIYVYKKVQFELAAEEFKSDFKDPYQIVTDLGKMYFVDKYKLDNVNSGRASDLNLSFIVDWETGKWKHGKFPMNWNKVKQNLKFIMESFVNSVKHTSVCMSYSNQKINPFGCYQTFSMDFIVDDKSNTWVLECNTRPWVGPGRWWKNFDSDYKHLNDKWVYFDSLLNLTVDQYCTPKKSTISWKNHWKQIVKINKKVFNKPTMYLQDIAPIEGIYNKSKTRRHILNTLSERGWSIFPWKKYLDNPDFVWQPITPLLKYLLEQNSYDEKKIVKAYPELLDAGIINRIFPLVVYLGNKGKLIEIIKNKLPNRWYNILPWSFSINKTSKDWKNKMRLMYAKGSDLYNNNSMTWIAKPSHGLQGLGIVISNDPDYIISEIDKDKDNGDEWVSSVYIGNPLLLKEKKNHIRVFVLVHRDKKQVKAYLFGRHFAFSAPLKYKECQSPDYKLDKEFCNLTNLAVGSRYYEQTPGKNPKDAYGDFSSIANESFNKDTYNQKIYKNVEKLPEYKKYKNIFIQNNKKLKKQGKQQLQENFYNVIMLPQIKKMVKDTIDSASPYISCIQEGNKNFESCFTYLAFDLMFDDGMEGERIPHAWLLEVNTSPGLRAPESEAGKIFQFLDNMFDKVLNKREKGAPVSKDKNQLFKEIYTLDKPMTPKLHNLVIDQMMLKSIEEQYKHKQLRKIPDLKKYKIKDDMPSFDKLKKERKKKLKKYIPQDIPKFKKYIIIPKSVKTKLKLIKEKKYHPRVKNCTCNNTSESLRKKLKSKKIPYYNLNKIQMCYLLNKFK